MKSTNVLFVNRNPDDPNLLKCTCICNVNNLPLFIFSAALLTNITAAGWSVVVVDSDNTHLMRFSSLTPNTNKMSFLAEKSYKK